MTNVHKIYGDNNFYPHSFDTAFDTLEFIKLTRAEKKAVTFLDDHNLSGNGTRSRVAVNELINEAISSEPKQDSGCAMIFHSAFCCSTLIARCLDIEGAGLALREPQTLNQLAHKKRMTGTQAADYKRLLGLIMVLFGRQRDTGEQVLIKPSNIANNLIEDCLESSYAGPVLLLYSSLETFLKSILKKGLWGNLYARKLYLTIQNEVPFAPDLEQSPVAGLADLQMAALAWYAQISVFSEILEKHPETRVKSLNCDDFLEARADTLSRAADFLGISANKSVFEAILEGPIAVNHAKQGGGPFSPKARQDQNEALEDTFGEQLQMVKAWAGEVSRPFNIPKKLKKAL